VATIEDDTWSRLEPHLSPYLTEGGPEHASALQRTVPEPKSETLSEDERKLIERYRSDKSLALAISQWYDTPLSVRKNILIEILQNAGNKEESGDPTVQ
jgi:hypothetical protein